MPSTDVSGPRLFNLSMEANPGFMEWGIDKRYLLLYLARVGTSVIRKRTASELDVNREMFARYREHYSAQREQSGEIVRDNLGRWNWILDRGPNTPVYLRSLFDVPSAKRMIENLKVSPKNPRPDVHSIYIKPQGGRSGVGHALRAHTVHYGKGTEEGFEEREFVGLSDFDWSFILSNIRKDHILAFVERLKQKWRAQLEATRDRNLKRAKRKKERQEKKTARAMKRAESGARSNHQRHLAYLKRMGVIQEDGESLREALKRASGERRAEKRLKRRKRKGWKSWTEKAWNLSAAQTLEVQGRRYTRRTRKRSYKL